MLRWHTQMAPARYCKPSQSVCMCSKSCRYVCGRGRRPRRVGVECLAGNDSAPMPHFPLGRRDGLPSHLHRRCSPACEGNFMQCWHPSRFALGVAQTRTSTTMRRMTGDLSAKGLFTPLSGSYAYFDSLGILFVLCISAGSRVFAVRKRGLRRPTRRAPTPLPPGPRPTP